MKRNTDFMLRDIAGEVILVPTGAATQQFNLDESESREILVDKIMDEFEVDRETATRDVIGFVSALYERGLVLDE